MLAGSFYVYFEQKIKYQLLNDSQKPRLLICLDIRVVVFRTTQFHIVSQTTIATKENGTVFLERHSRFEPGV